MCFESLCPPEQFVINCDHGATSCSSCSPDFDLVFHRVHWEQTVGLLENSTTRDLLLVRGQTHLGSVAPSTQQRQQQGFEWQERSTLPNTSSQPRASFNRESYTHSSSTILSRHGPYRIEVPRRQSESGTKISLENQKQALFSDPL